MMNELRETLEQVDRDKAVKGIVLTSGVPRIFSGGLDIMALYQPNDQEYVLTIIIRFDICITTFLIVLFTDCERFGLLCKNCFCQRICCARRR